jgi:hypothetical protein
MKAIILISFFSVMFVHHVNAQTVSSQKNAKISEPVESVNSTQASTTATLVSGARHAEVREVPIENKTEENRHPVNTEATPSQRKPD